MAADHWRPLDLDAESTAAGGQGECEEQHPHGLAADRDQHERRDRQKGGDRGDHPDRARRDTMYQAATTINASISRLAIGTCQRWRADSVT